MLKALTKMFGTSNDRALKKVQPILAAVNDMEPRIKQLTDEQLKAKTPELRQKIENGAPLDSLLVEAFAVTREAARRVLGMRPYDVQIIGGTILHQGKIAEMKTGEGKTLVATLPVYLNALSGKGVHVVTVNDYLARRDAEWMGQFYRWMGLSVGCVLNGITEDVRKQAYLSDITYGQNNEFGFDYLRDNMKFSLDSYVQRELNFALIDEVDSILIDEARTPLIISGAPEDSSELYVTVDKLIPRLKKDIDYNVDEKSHSATMTDAGVEKMEGLLEVDNLYHPSNRVLLHHVENALKAHTLYRRDVNYLVQGGEVMIIDEHTGRAMSGRRWSDGLHQAVEAKEGVNIQPENHTLATVSFQNYFRLYNKLAGMTGTAKTEEEEFNKIYKLETVVIPTNRPIQRHDNADMVYLTEKGKFRAVVEEIKERHVNGQPMLIGTTSVEKSEIIHRMLKAQGIDHNVLNAKQHSREATIVAQAGRLKAVTVATNMAGRGTDIILGGNAEYAGQAMFEELGYIRYSAEWERVEYFVKQLCIGKEDEARGMMHEFEEMGRPVPEKVISEIIRLRDIFKAEKAKVLEAGGLCIIGTERHESRRIDNQLRGRAGRQGDPGVSRFYLSLEDNLMRIFSSDRMRGLMERLGMSDDAPIEHGMVSKSIENAQRKVEGQHFDARKNLIEYDDVMNQQRQTIYAWRRQVLGAEEPQLKEITLDAIDDLVRNLVEIACPPDVRPQEWKLDELIEAVRNQFDHSVVLDDLPIARPKFEERIYFKVEEKFLALQSQANEVNGGELHRLAKELFLRQIDEQWKDHLQTMAQLRQGVGLRGYGQKDPKKEYQKEGFRLFTDLLINIKAQVLGQLIRVQVPSMEEMRKAEEERIRQMEEINRRMAALAKAEAEGVEAPAEARQQPQQQGAKPQLEKRPQAQGPRPDQVLASRPRRAATRRARPKIGRNDPCWCGSGKKYKKCHMALDEAEAAAAESEA
ncbi:MAG: preprotein translocase subunit SecA [Bradymonadia bacterium]